MPDKLKIPYPVVVEGKYDREVLSRVIEGNIIKTDGFGIFSRDELSALLRRLSEAGKIIVLTDPDGAGRLIRSRIHGILPPDRIIDLYVPDIKGKEKRKTAPSAAGLLGVEGMTPELLRSLFEPYAGGALPTFGGITKTDMYTAGLSGTPDASSRRRALCEALSLPKEMSAGALLSALNLLTDRDGFMRLADELEL